MNPSICRNKGTGKQSSEKGWIFICWERYEGVETITIIQPHDLW